MGSQGLVLQLGAPRGKGLGAVRGPTEPLLVQVHGAPRLGRGSRLLQPAGGVTRDQASGVGAGKPPLPRMYAASLPAPTGPGPSPAPPPPAPTPPKGLQTHGRSRRPRWSQWGHELGAQEPPARTAPVPPRLMGGAHESSSAPQPGARRGRPPHNGPTRPPRGLRVAAHSRPSGPPRKPHLSALRPKRFCWMEADETHPGAEVLREAPTMGGERRGGMELRRENGAALRTRLSRLHRSSPPPASRQGLAPGGPATRAAGPGRSGCWRQKGRAQAAPGAGPACESTEARLGRPWRQFPVNQSRNE